MITGCPFVTIHAMLMAGLMLSLRALSVLLSNVAIHVRKSFIAVALRPPLDSLSLWRATVSKISLINALIIFKPSSF